MMRTLLCAIALLCITIPAPASAGFEEGHQAFNDGDWTRAKAEMQPLAEAGDAKAQIAMGLLYARGQAVDQNWHKAAYWFAVAVESARTMRDRVTRTMLRILASENLTYSVRRSSRID